MHVRPAGQRQDQVAQLVGQVRFPGGSIVVGRHPGQRLRALLCFDGRLPVLRGGCRRSRHLVAAVLRHRRVGGKACAEGGVVDVQHLAQRCLVTAGQVPGDRQLARCAALEHDAVALRELLAGQPATEGIVNVRVGTGLVQQHIAALELSQHQRQSFQESFRLRGIGVVLTDRAVLNPRLAGPFENVVGAIAVVHVRVEDADAVGDALGQQHPGGHQTFIGCPPEGKVGRLRRPASMESAIAGCARCSGRMRSAASRWRAGWWGPPPADFLVRPAGPRVRATPARRPVAPVAARHA